ncbi:MAG: DUF4214 domain-containing protein [Acidimicrobiales bacterium]
MFALSLRTRRPLFVAALALLAVSLFSIAPASAANANATSVLEQQLLSQINAERANRGIAPVTLTQSLNVASDNWSSTMASSQNLRHSTDGRAEIIARGFWTGQITNAWMYSDGHRNLIVDPNLTQAGVGVVCDGNGQMWATVQFLRNDKTKETLRSSSQSPVITKADSGSSCGDDRYLGGVQRLYQAFFRRQSDAGGLAYWVEARSSNISLNQIADVFVTSPEFQQTYGSLNNRQFVDLIYRNVLKRSPDGSGYDYWLSLLAKGKLSRGQLMVQFSDSAEFQALTGIYG